MTTEQEKELALKCEAFSKAVKLREELLSRGWAFIEVRQHGVNASGERGFQMNDTELVSRVKAVCIDYLNEKIAEMAKEIK